MLGASVGLASCQENTLEALEQEKKDLVAEHKQAIRDHKAELFMMDSLIAGHPESANQKEEKIKLVPVTVQNVTVKTFEHFFEVHGNVEVVEHAALFAQAPGNIKVIHVSEGTTVKKGQVLISLDASAVESGIKELEKGLELATKVFNKQKSLWDQKIGSEIQFLEVKNNKEALDQKLVTLREQLNMYQIEAPFNGVVDEIMPKVGEAAVPGYALARILNLGKIYLESDVSEKYISSVKAGGFVEVKFPSLNETVKARVTRVGNFINPSNRTFKVKVEFANPRGKYKPNQLAVMKIRDYKSVNALVIPARIIQQDRSGQDYVYTFEQKDAKRVKKLELKVGKSYEGMVEILNGLDSATVLIDKGAKSVQANDAIEIK